MITTAVLLLAFAACSQGRTRRRPQVSLIHVGTMPVLGYVEGCA
jgi:hypothetical protein